MYDLLNTTNIPQVVTLIMFGLFGKSAAKMHGGGQDYYGQETYNPDGSVTMTPVLIKHVKLAGQEYIPGDPNSIAKFHQKLAQVQQSGGNEMIQIDGTDTYAPAASAAGKKELIRMQLQMDGYSDDAINQAMQGLEAPAKKAYPYWLKAKTPTDSAPPSADTPSGSESAVPASAKASGKSQTFRSPRGPVPAH